MNKIALITWLNGRKELSAKVLRYFSQFDLSHFIAIGTDCQDVCKGTKFKYTECENDPLGNKWNEAFRQLKGLDFDYVLIVGSDDFVSSNAIDFYLNEANRDVYEFSDIFICDELNKESIYLNEIDNCGAGMLIKREFIELMNFEPVPNHIKKGLDRNIKEHLKKYGAKVSYVSYALNRFALIDIKNGYSMNSFDSLNNRNCVELDYNYVIGLVSTS